MQVQFRWPDEPYVHTGLRTGAGLQLRPVCPARTKRSTQTPVQGEVMTAMPAKALPPLPNIYEIDPAGPQDRACFDELREVLERHGALQRFGITLLHQHFEMAPDEVLVESVDTENRILTMRPVSAKPNERAVETSWRLDDPSAQR